MYIGFDPRPGFRVQAAGIKGCFFVILNYMRMNFLIRWFIGSLTVLMVVLFSGSIWVESLYVACMIALIIGLVDACIPYLVGAFSFTTTILSVGLFLLLGNSFLLYLIQSLGMGFMTRSFNSMMLAAITISTIAWFSAIALESKLIIK